MPSSNALRALLLAAVAMWPAVSNGEVLFFAAVGSGPGSLLVFDPTSGVSITGETSSDPVFPVQLTSLDGQTLFADGSVVDTGVGGPGFNSIEIVPDFLRVRQINFTIDSFDITVPIDASSPNGSLTVTVTDSFGGISTAHLAFPYSDNRIHQGYGVAVQTTDPQPFITSLTISYVDPNQSGNTIRSLYNIDIDTLPEPVPEPSAFALSSIVGGLVALRELRRRLTTR
jgi:hypothetical protein